MMIYLFKPQFGYLEANLWMYVGAIPQTLEGGTNLFSSSNIKRWILIFRYILKPLLQNMKKIFHIVYFCKLLEKKS